MREMLLAAAISIASALASAVPASATVIDLYAGTGTFTSTDTVWAFLPSSVDITDVSFSDTSWNVIASGSHWFEASGNLAAAVISTISVDYTTLPLTFDYFAFSGPNLVFADHYGFDGGLGTSAPIAGDTQGAFNADLAASTGDTTGAVPEPLTLALFAAGLLGLALLRFNNGGMIPVRN